jgi:hypothetical protein
VEKIRAALGGPPYTHPDGKEEEEDPPGAATQQIYRLFSPV